MMHKWVKAARITLSMLTDTAGLLLAGRRHEYVDVDAILTLAALQGRFTAEFDESVLLVMSHAKVDYENAPLVVGG